MDKLEARASQGIEGTVLERIVHKRLNIIWGPVDVAWFYKYGITESGDTTRNPRSFAGGIELDFGILARPNQRILDLEVQGWHWHGPNSQYEDNEKALMLLGLGFDYAEVWEWEIAAGDAYLDERLLQLIGATAAVSGKKKYPVRTFAREEVEEIGRQT